MKALVALVLATVATISNAALYDFTTDFSITNGNPNGAWSYGYRASPSAARVLFNNPIITSTGISWRSTTLGSDPQFYKNQTGSTANGVPSGQIAMHPGPSGELASLLFTAPIAGDLTLNAAFGAGDIGNVDLFVRVNGLPVYSVLNTNGGGSFALTTPVPVTAGNTVEVLVGYGDASYAFDSTPVSATINIAQPVPEPATVAILGVGALGLLRRRARKN